MEAIKQKTITTLNNMIQRNHLAVNELKIIANKNGFLYVIVDEDGAIQAMRKTLGTANRLLNIGKFNILSGLPIDVERYFVVSIHLSELES